MSGLVSVTVQPLGRQVAVRPGQSLFMALAEADIALNQACGGKGFCGKCLVRLKGPAPVARDEERRHLSEEQIAQGFRLACNLQPRGGEQIEIISPAASVPAKLDLPRSEFSVDPWPGLQPGDLVMALDLGTTNLVGHLLDPHTGRALRATSLLNSQSVFGADVMSRLTHASHGGPHARREMQQLVLGDLTALAAPWGLAEGEVKHLVGVMNTAMASLLLDWDPDVLGRHPCRIQQVGPIHLLPSGLSGALAGVSLHLPPMLGGFVGADTTSALWAALAQGPQPPFALMDIGTNAEVALVNREEILCCSCAAGPAFEGGGLSAGMRAAPGAIDHVVIDQGMVEYSVIGNSEPRGITGSGMLSLTASLLRAGALDRFGALLPKALDPAVLQTGSGGREIRLYPGVSVSEQDIEQFMLAKAAAAAGLEILLAQAEIDLKEITQIFICGTFASHLEVDDVLTVGLVPAELGPCIIGLGNAAALGAAMMACSHRDFRHASRLASRTRHLSLSGSNIFKEVFGTHMRFH
jgi:uncharacterized 2Fe-2S/4Fe-4S cluster protein (DUF4445 family)